MRIFMICISLFLLSSTAMAKEMADIHLKDGTTFSQSELQAVIDNTAIVKTEYGINHIPLKKIEQIVFPDGSKEQPGIMTRSGVFSGKLDEFKEGQWKFSLSGDKGTLYIRRSGEVLSINLEKPNVDIKKFSHGGDVLYTYILDVVYNKNVVGEGTGSNWILTIKKIHLANNKISVDFVVSRYEGESNCYVKFRFLDDKNRRSTVIGRSLDINAMREQAYSIEFPQRPPDSKYLIFQFYSNDSYCQPTGKWHFTPQIPIEMLINQ